MQHHHPLPPETEHVLKASSKALRHCGFISWMDREHNSIFHFQSEMKNLNISKASKEQTMMISPRFINVRVKHQHLGHLAKVTNCHQSPVFWLVLTPIEWCWLQIDSHFQALLTTKYWPCSRRFWANANHAFKALYQLLHLFWGLFSQFTWQDLKTCLYWLSTKLLTFQILAFSKLPSKRIFMWGVHTGACSPQRLNPIDSYRTVTVFHIKLFISKVSSVP